MKKLTPKQKKRRELLSDSNKPCTAPDSSLPLLMCIALLFRPNPYNYGLGK